MPARLNYCFLLIFWVFGAVRAQDGPSKMDSLRTELELANSDLKKAHILCDMAKISYGLDSVTAFEYPKKALEIFKKEKDSFGIGRAYAAFGSVYF